MRNFFTFLLISIFFSFTSLSQEVRSTTFDNREVCDQNKGIWRQFGNGCAGNCNAKFERFKVCTMAITFACDCGVEKCWDSDNKKCVLLDDYKVIFDKNKEEEQKKLDEMKEARKNQAKENAANIVNKLVKNYQVNQSVNDIKAVDAKGNPISNNLSPQGNLDQFYGGKTNTIANVFDSKQQNQQQKIVQNSENKAIQPKQSENLEISESQSKFEIPASYLQKIQQKKDQEIQDASVVLENAATKIKEEKNTYKGLDEGLPQIPLPN